MQVRNVPGRASMGAAGSGSWSLRARCVCSSHLRPSKQVWWPRAQDSRSRKRRRKSLSGLSGLRSYAGPGQQVAWQPSWGAATATATATATGGSSDSSDPLLSPVFPASGNEFPFPPSIWPYEWSETRNTPRVTGKAGNDIESEKIR